jgi:hypothetical protein
MRHPLILALLMAAMAMGGSACSDMHARQTSQDGMGAAGPSGAGPSGGSAPGSEGGAGAGGLIGNQ